MSDFKAMSDNALQQALNIVKAERDEAQKALEIANTAVAELSKEYHAAINEPEYAGTRQDWIGRCFSAEATIREQAERIKELESTLRETKDWIFPDLCGKPCEHTDCGECRAFLKRMESTLGGK